MLSEEWVRRIGVDTVYRDGVYYPCPLSRPNFRKLYIRTEGLRLMPLPASIESRIDEAYLEIVWFRQEAADTKNKTISEIISRQKTVSDWFYIDVVEEFNRSRTGHIQNRTRKSLTVVGNYSRFLEEYTKAKSDADNEVRVSKIIRLIELGVKEEDIIAPKLEDENTQEINPESFERTIPFFIRGFENYTIAKMLGYNIIRADQL